MINGLITFSHHSSLLWIRDGAHNWRWWPRVWRSGAGTRWIIRRLARVQPWDHESNHVIISINNIVSSQVTISMEEKARDPLLVVLVVDLVAMVEEWGRQHTEDTGAGVGPTTG